MGLILPLFITWNLIWQLNKSETSTEKFTFLLTSRFLRNYSEGHMSISTSNISRCTPKGSLWLLRTTRSTLGNNWVFTAIFKTSFCKNSLWKKIVYWKNWSFTDLIQKRKMKFNMIKQIYLIALMSVFWVFNQYKNWNAKKPLNWSYWHLSKYPTWKKEKNHLSAVNW